jgi:hypothetical protein
MNDLNTIIPAHLEVSAGGQLITVKPFTFGQLPKVMTLSKTIYGHISALFDSDIDQTQVIIEAMAVGGEDLIAMICLSTGKSREWFDTLEMDDGVRLTGAFLEVNLGFFVRKVMPELKITTQRLKNVALPTP